MKWFRRLQDFKLCNLRCDISRTVITLKLYCGLKDNVLYEVKATSLCKARFHSSLPCDLLLGGYWIFWMTYVCNLGLTQWISLVNLHQIDYTINCDNYDILLTLTTPEFFDLLNQLPKNIQNQSRSAHLQKLLQVLRGPLRTGTGVDWEGSAW